MQKILLALIASLIAVPAFAQVIPGQSTTGTQGSAQAGVSATGMPSNTAVGVSAGTNANTSGTDASGNSTLGLGGLLKQTQADPSATAPQEGAGPTGSLDTKARVKKARARGH